MSGSKNCPETPRQKMIGMMYLVLTAMLALNVSADILNGFSMVDRSLGVSIGVSKSQSDRIEGEMQSAFSQNEKKVGPWLKEQQAVKAQCDSIYNYLESCKEQICRIADGKDIDYKPGYDLEGKGNLDAAGTFAQIGSDMKRGKELKQKIDDFRAFVESQYNKKVYNEKTGKVEDVLVDGKPVRDSAKVAQYESMFSTGKSKNSHGEMVDWINANFESMPAVASVTLLSKYQNDVRATQAELYQHLLSNVDAGDFRVNKIEALVLPESNYVTRGGQYSAKIVLAATDSTKKPVITIGNNVIENGIYKVGCGTVGHFTYKGTLVVTKPDGSTQPYDFSSSYTVGEPTVTVSADLMNVFYAGFDNPVSISVPGVPSQNLQATMTGGSLVRTAKGWIAKPARVGQNCKISVSAKDEKGQVRPMGSKEFRVKALPAPIAFINCKDKNGNPLKYKGGKPIPKALLLEGTGVRAELDDADLDVRYNVTKFDVNLFDAMGNSMVYSSNSTRFSDQQVAQLRKLTKGKKFYISNVHAIGPDKIDRVLPPIEVIIQ